MDAVEDLKQIVDFTTKETKKGREKTVLVGASLGGYISLISAMNTPFHSIVVIGGAFDFAKRINLNPTNENGDIILDSVYSGRLVLGRDIGKGVPSDEYLSDALKQQCVLSVHGQMDEVVPIQLARNFFAINRNPDSWFWEVDRQQGGDHRLNKPLDKILEKVTHTIT
mmetsp:Transcript_17480/g.28266  ORF Transcript_17480/g.28266 Transcript_17480/m.28266 type:complete len:168 (-) Transcript_17480:860-1363(-)